MVNNLFLHPKHVQQFKIGNGMDRVKQVRLFDANVNRAKEGLRVVEDLFRFGADDYKISKELKSIRHGVQQVVDDSLVTEQERLQARDSIGDVGLKVKSASEMQRDNIESIFLSNIRRASESLRVLEEISKLLTPVSAEHFKLLRYHVYDLEKTLFPKLY